MYIIDINENTKAVCSMLVSKKNSYTKLQKEIACNINYKSNGSYKFLQQDLELHLPTSRSLYNYNKLKKIGPGFDSGLIPCLKEVLPEFAAQTNEPLEILIIYDEITLRRELSYNPSSKSVDGFVDYGFIRTADIGKQALVYMVSGINFNFKYPLNYFISKSATPHTLCRDILLENIRICTYELSVIVRGWCSDQGSNFRACSRSLNVSFIIY